MSLSDIVDIKLNKTDQINRTPAGYNLFDGNFQTNRLMNALDLQQRDDDGNLVISNDVNSDNIDEIIGYLSNTFKFIGITEYHRQSLSWLFAFTETT